jgi:hypothetical protein
MSSDVQAWYLQRGARFLGAMGWVVNPSHAMRFTSADEASAGLVDLLVSSPKLVGGDVRIVPLEYTPKHTGIAMVSSDYDPFRASA